MWDHFCKTSFVSGFYCLLHTHTHSLSSTWKSDYTRCKEQFHRWCTLVSLLYLTSTRGAASSLRLQLARSLQSKSKRMTKISLGQSSSSSLILRSRGSRKRNNSRYGTIWSTWCDLCGRSENGKCQLIGSKQSKYECSVVNWNQTTRNNKPTSIHDFITVLVINWLLYTCQCIRSTKLTQ